MTRISLFEQRMRRHRPKRVEQAFEVHALQLRYPALSEIHHQSEQLWRSLGGEPLHADSYGFWQAADGSGLRVTRINIGPFSGDGVDVRVEFLLPCGIYATFVLGMDYQQRTVRVVVTGRKGQDLEFVMRNVSFLAHKLRSEPQR